MPENSGHPDANARNKAGETPLLAFLSFDNDVPEDYVREAGADDEFSGRWIAVEQFIDNEVGGDDRCPLLRFELPDNHTPTIRHVHTDNYYVLVRRWSGWTCRTALIGWTAQNLFKVPALLLSVAIIMAVLITWGIINTNRHVYRKFDELGDL